jgi:DNA-binding NtrC family response regulator
MPTVLVIDDNPAVATALEVMFDLHGIRTLSATSPDEGLALLKRERIDLVLQDMNFTRDTTSGEEGIALFRAIREQDAEIPVILLTAWTHLETAVDLVRGGAADYLAKPWDDRKLLTTVGNLLELAHARQESAGLRREHRAALDSLRKRYDLAGYLFESPAMARVVGIACQVARADVPVLITGPNGAGKDGMARILHQNSSVKTGPFIAVNCGALPSELIEAELFGAEAGAYTGANKAREGRFEAADGGTLFLDEIGNLPPSGQMKLLRVLETGQFERLGSTRTRQVKVRVVSATNADVRGMIKQGRFREDLYYRLNVIEIGVPPLAERREDILPLAHAFLQNRAILEDAARDGLLAYDWPGNVRELKNAIERAVLLCRDGRIAAADLSIALPSAALSGASTTARTRDSGDVEPDRDAIESALARAGGVISQAASELGLSRQALYRRMEKMGISQP